MVIMRQDDEIFAQKSKTYRKNYNQNIAALYGDKTNIPVKPPTKRKKPRSHDPLSEHYIQIKLVQWARMKGLTLISIPNHGKRSAWAGQKEVAMGLTKGVSDLFLAHPSGVKSGYWIELKRPGRCPTFDQYAWLKKMREHGYAADWFDDFDKAKSAIEQYLAGLLPAA